MDWTRQRGAIVHDVLKTQEEKTHLTLTDPFLIRSKRNTTITWLGSLFRNGAVEGA